MKKDHEIIAQIEELLDAAAPEQRARVEAWLKLKVAAPVPFLQPPQFVPVPFQVPAAYPTWPPHVPHIGDVISPWLPPGTVFG